MSVCWHDFPVPGHHRCPGMEPGGLLFWYGRVRSGKRWFWAVESADLDAGGTVLAGHGREDSGAAAEFAARKAIRGLAGERDATATFSRQTAVSALKKVTAQRRAARPPSAETASTQVGFLYEPWCWWGETGECHTGIAKYPIVKTTARRVYFTRPDALGRVTAVPDAGFVVRAALEPDTRCHEECPRTIPAALVCTAHSREHPHCAHFGPNWFVNHPECRPRGCAEECPRTTPGWRCGEHEWRVWPHCRHGHDLGECWHGHAPGAARISRGRYGGGVVFTTLGAAEDHLAARLRAAGAVPGGELEAEVRKLRREMAAAHPDRGGTAEAFIAAQERYEKALRRMPAAVQEPQEAGRP